LGDGLCQLDNPECGRWGSAWIHLLVLRVRKMKSPLIAGLPGPRRLEVIKRW